jgi:endo-beta-N-acetylglucosaminidase D
MNDKKVLFVEGKGFWQGLPARDLTADEWAEVSQENQKTILSLGIYKLVESKSTKKDYKDGDE